jgi:hypothetical protein
MAILLVKPLVFKLKKNKNLVSVVKNEEKQDIKPTLDENGNIVSDEEDDDEDQQQTIQNRVGVDLHYQKRVEGRMRLWIEAPGCRQVVSDKYFKNPVSTHGKFLFFYMYYSCN